MALINEEATGRPQSHHGQHPFSSSCFFCFKELPVNNFCPEENFNSKRSLVSLKSILCHLQIIPTQDQIGNESDFWNQQFQLCESCAQVRNTLSELIQLKEVIEMKIGYWEEVLEKILSDGDDKKAEEDKDLVDLTEESELRENIRNKCFSKRASSRVLRVQLKRLLPQDIPAKPDTPEPEMESPSSPEASFGIDEDYNDNDDGDSSFRGAEQSSDEEISDYSSESEHDPDLELEPKSKPKPKSSPNRKRKPSRRKRGPPRPPILGASEGNIPPDQFQMERNFTAGIFKCQFQGTCSKKFKDYKAAYDHYRTIHLGLLYECKGCNHKFQYSTQFFRHRKECQSGEPKKEKRCICEVCGKEFGLRKNLNAHMREVHLQAKKFQCDICGNYYSRRSTVRFHKKWAHDEDHE